MLQGIVLTNGDVLLTEIVEVMADLGEPNCRLVNPFIITNNQLGLIDIQKYLNDFTEDSEFMILSDKILTIFEPKDSLKSKYYSLVEDTKKVEKRESNLEENVD
jgi:hypothetical protein